VLIGPGSIWKPSRGPSSWISTFDGKSDMQALPGKLGGWRWRHYSRRRGEATRADRACRDAREQSAADFRVSAPFDIDEG
jgi:hypothetical protein